MFDHYSKVWLRDSVQTILRNIVRGQTRAHMRLGHWFEKRPFKNE